MSCPHFTYLTFTGVDEKLGVEKSRRIVAFRDLLDGNGGLAGSTRTIEAVRSSVTLDENEHVGLFTYSILPSKDLFIDRPIEFEMLVPLYFLKVRPSSQTTQSQTQQGDTASNITDSNSTAAATTAAATTTNLRPSFSKTSITILASPEVTNILASCNEKQTNPAQISEHGQFMLPWMEKVKYPLSVWYFTIRHFFRKQALLDKPWMYSTSSTLADDARVEGIEKFYKDVCLHQANSKTGSCTNPFPVHFGVGSTRGNRNYMEDVSVALNDEDIVEKQTVALYCVFDGHGGKDCADYCAEHLPQKLFSYLKHNKPCPEALFRAFVDVDREFLDSSYSDSNSGSTANAVLYNRSSNTFFIANVGDARSVLSRGGTAKDLSVDRKATDPEEVARIAREGGFVSKGRVLGSLAVSRAMGDSQLKERSDRPVLISDPELSCFRPQKSDEFIVVASDGLWDVMSSQEVLDIIRTKLHEQGLLPLKDEKSSHAVGEALSRIAQFMAVYAVNDRKSNDNVTVLIVLIDQLAAFVEPEVFDSRSRFEKFGGVNDALLGGVAKQSETGLKGSVLASSTEPSPSSTPPSSATRRQKAPLSLLSDEGDSLSAATAASSSNITRSIPSPYGSSASSRISSFINQAGAKAGAEGGAGDVDYRKGRHRLEDNENEPPTGGGRGGGGGASKAIVTEDDMMDFLNDDSNF